MSMLSYPGYGRRSVTMDSLLCLTLGVAVGASGVGMVVFLRQRWGQQTVATAEETAKLILEEAKKEGAVIKKEAQIQAKDIVLQAKAESEKEVRERRREVQQNEKRLQSREETLEKRAEILENRETDLLRREQGLKSKEEARQEAERRAKKVICVAVERLAGEFVSERTASVIHLPSDDMKGRIIGREGRNIRTIEAATGVDLIIDDTPEAVLISSHSPIRREIARVALDRLIADGRIHPGRIEEVVKKAEQEVEEAVREAGQRAVLELGVHGVHPELLKLLGMLKYRYSYGQNVLMHSLETAYICGIMAAELGLNEKQARRAGLLHDIGKAVSHEIEGSHAIIGGEVARKYGESAKIVNAIAAHHEEVKAETVLAPLVDAADALSGARPGARREVLESYVRRLEALEHISNSFSGVA